jgi:hypothetical protein
MLSQGAVAFAQPMVAVFTVPVLSGGWLQSIRVKGAPAKVA